MLNTDKFLFFFKHLIQVSLFPLTVKICSISKFASVNAGLLREEERKGKRTKDIFPHMVVKMGKNFVSRCLKAGGIKRGVPQIGNIKKKRAEGRRKGRAWERLHFAWYSWGRAAESRGEGKGIEGGGFWSISKTFPFFVIFLRKISFGSRTLLRRRNIATQLGK